MYIKKLCSERVNYKSVILVSCMWTNVRARTHVRSNINDGWLNFTRAILNIQYPTSSQKSKSHAAFYCDFKLNIELLSLSVLYSSYFITHTHTSSVNGSISLYWLNFTVCQQFMVTWRVSWQNVINFRTQKIN